MSKPTLQPIAVDVALPEYERSAVERALLAGRVAEHISELIEDLGLPAVAQVRLVDRGHYDQQGPAQMAIAVDGKLCRSPWLPFYERNRSDLSELTGIVSSVIYLNRQLLLTSGVLQALADERPAHVIGLLPEMVRRGYSLQVAEEIAGRIIPTLDVESRRYQLELFLGDFAPVTVSVEVGERLHRQMIERTTRPFSEMINLMRDGLFYELGVKIPPVRLIHNKTLPDFDFRINLGLLRGPTRRGLQNGEFLINATPAYLADALKIDARPARNPATGDEFAIVMGEEAVSRSKREMLLTDWDPADYVGIALAEHLRVSAEFFLTAADVQRMLAKLSEAFPLLIVDLLERFSPRFVLDVFRSLVRERFSIRDLRGVMEGMLELNGELADMASGEIAVLPPAAKLSRFAALPAGLQAAQNCADNVRIAMRRYVTSRYTNGGAVTVLETSQTTEARLRTCRPPIRGREHGVLTRIIATIIEQTQPSSPLVILTAVDLRRRIREAIEIEFPYVAVLSRAELEKELMWRGHSLISWPESDGASAIDKNFIAGDEAQFSQKENESTALPFRISR